MGDVGHMAVRAIGTPTSDPTVWIEEQRDGYVRYRNADGRRWEVHGVCDRRGDCLIGAVIEHPRLKGGQVVVEDHAHLGRLCRYLGRDRIDSEMDVPVTPEFQGCCPFRFVELEPHGD